MEWPPEVWAKLREREEQSFGLDPGLRVVVDSVRSQWNVGSIFRTCDGAGFTHVHLCGISPIPTASTGKPDGVAKTALGAERAVPWSYRVEIAPLLDELAAAGFTCVALEQTPTAIPIAELPARERIALVVGHEVSGVSSEALERCSVHVDIPMAGIKDSLNVAVAFGVAAYQLRARTARK